jgi:chromate reductase
MTDPSSVRVLGLSGSLRKKSFNTALLHAARVLMPHGMTLEIGSIAVPLYDDDVYQAGLPEPVKTLRAQIAAADAILFSTPEYNHSIPGGLKNAIDWASRQPNMPFAGKPCAIMGATPGAFGTVRAQSHLRGTMVFLNMFPLNKPEVLVMKAPEKFDAELRLTDETTRKMVKDMLEALAAWTRKIRGN